jgi:hypothetical protein
MYLSGAASRLLMLLLMPHAWGVVVPLQPTLHAIHCCKRRLARLFCPLLLWLAFAC